MSGRRRKELGNQGRTLLTSQLEDTTRSTKASRGRKMAKRQLSSSAKQTQGKKKTMKCDPDSPMTDEDNRSTGGNSHTSSRGRTSNYIAWTPDEDKTLSGAIKKFGEENWTSVSALLPGRTQVQCQQRWKKFLAPGLIKGTWSPQEDKVLLELIHGHQGAGKDVREMNWQHVATQIPGRNAKQCRERWFLNLDPSIKRGAWSASEDELLLRLSEELNNRWSQIAKNIEGRTENNVKTRYHSLMRQAARSKPWTAEEDAKLKHEAIMQALDWATITKLMPSRSRLLLKKRFQELCTTDKELAQRASSLQSSSNSVTSAGPKKASKAAAKQSRGGPNATSASASAAHIALTGQVALDRVQSSNISAAHFSKAGPSVPLVAIPPTAQLLQQSSSTSLNDSSGSGGNNLRRYGSTWLSSFQKPLSTGNNSMDLSDNVVAPPPELMRVNSHTVLTDLMDGTYPNDDQERSGNSSKKVNGPRREKNAALRHSGSSMSTDDGAGSFAVPNRRTPPLLSRGRNESSLGMLDTLLGKTTSLERSSSSLDAGSDAGSGGNLFSTDNSPPSPALPPPGQEAPSMSLNAGETLPWSSLLPGQVSSGDLGTFLPPQDTNRNISGSGSDKRREKMLQNHRSSSEISQTLMRESSLDFKNFLNSL